MSARNNRPAEQMSQPQRKITEPMQPINIMKRHCLWLAIAFDGNNIQSPLRSLARAFLPSAAVILTLLLSTASSSFAGSAIWKKSPTTNDWQTASNWTPRTVPNGPGDTATFASSNITAVDLAQFGDIEVNGIVFKPGASAFTISNEIPNLIISGVGIMNNS